MQGDEGFLWVTRCTGQLLDLPALVLYRGTDNRRTTTSFTDLDDDWGAGFKRSSAHFVAAVLDGIPPVMTADDAVKVLQLCFAVYRAGETGERVDPRTAAGPVVGDGRAAS